MFSKKHLLVISIVLSIFILFTGCQEEGNIDNDIDSEERNDQSTITNHNEAKYKTLISEDYNNLEMDQLNKYQIEVDFNPSEKTYTVAQRVVYVNNEEVDLDSIYFHLYPNTFREKETAPFLFDNFESAFPEGFEPGYIDIDSILIDNGITDNYVISGIGSTILELPLKKSLAPGEKADIIMAYSVKLPPAQDRFGYGDKTYNLGNWYPIAAVYDDEGWNLDPYYSIGDPFYSDTSNYDVTIKAPKEFIIASSGNILSEEIEGDYKTWKIEARLMRDFAWVASEYFSIIEKDVEGTLVKNYFLDENNTINELAASDAYDSIEIFNKIFGEYPYGQYSVVATNFPSGMEYPGIVFIGDKYYNYAYRKYLETVIVHETGHQWWYSIVGNDEIDEAWLDESLTSYSEVVYMDEKHGEEVAEEYYTQNTANSYNFTKKYLPDEIVLKSLSEFKDWTDYGSLAYSKGVMFIREIEKLYGKEILHEIFQQYYDKYKFLNATTTDFIDVCEGVTGEDFTQLVNYWLYSK